VPPFTANALRKRGMDVSFHSRKTIERGVFVAMIAYVAVDVFSAPRMLIVAVSAIAATMILAIMTRASLGHTGRPLVAAPAITVAYVSLVLAIAVRGFGPALLPVSYTTVLLAVGSLWVLTFLLFAIVYAPILLGLRVDGKSG
jgi:uncharacterized protein involved in response to NO